MNLVYIMGRPHCGSTILNLLLGNAGNVAALGELHQLGKWGQRQCVCGAKAEECTFWINVKARFEKRAGTSISWDQLVNLVANAHTFSRAIALLRSPTKGKDTLQFRDGMIYLYGAIAEEADANFVVDSSRNPFVASFFLRNIPSTKVIYLVRNINDSVYSKLNRMKRGMGFHWANFHWRSKGRIVLPFLLLNGISWLAGNFIADRIAKRHRDAVLTVRYEDLCREPEVVLARNGSFTGIDLTEVIDRQKQMKPFRTSHEIRGNKMMMEKEEIVFRPDAGKPLPIVYRVIVNAIALRLSVKYRYIGWYKE